MNNGWVKLFRSTREWEWYGDYAVLTLWIHILLEANYAEKQWQGVVVGVGEMATSVAKLAFETGLSVQQTRTALKKLESTNEITCKTTNKYTLIRVNKWDEYQTNNKQTTNNPTNEQQQDKNIRRKEDKNIYNMRFKKPTIDEIRAYCQERKNAVDPEKFWNYYESNGWKVGKNPMKDWRACIRGTWEKRAEPIKVQDDLPTYDPNRNKRLSDEELNNLLSLKGTI